MSDPAVDMDMLRAMLRQYGQENLPEQSSFDAERGALAAGRRIDPAPADNLYEPGVRQQYGAGSPMPPTSFTDGTSSPEDHVSRLMAQYAEKERLRPQYEAELAREARYDAAAPASGGVAVPGFYNDRSGRSLPMDLGPNPGGAANLDEYLRTRDAQWLPPPESEINWR